MNVHSKGTGSGCTAVQTRLIAHLFMQSRKKQFCTWQDDPGHHSSLKSDATQGLLADASEHVHVCHHTPNPKPCLCQSPC